MRPPRRVVSLVPSLTETLFDIGAGDAVVGATNFCIFPEMNVPRVGGTKNPRVAEIRELKPDLVYVNVEENLSKHAEAIREFAPVVATHPKTVRDVVDLIRMLGLIHGQREKAGLIADEIEQVSTANGSFTFAVPIWKDPWMWCGGDTYVSDLVTTVGGKNVLAFEKRYPAHSDEEILGLDPDIIFLPDEPFVFTESDADSFRDAGATIVIGPFPGHLFTWHGSRTLLGLRFLHEVLPAR